MAYSETVDIITIEAEHAKVKNQMEELEQAEQLEEETHAIKMQIQSSKYERQNKQYENEIRRLRENNECIVEQQCLVAELKRLEKEAQSAGPAMVDSEKIPEPMDISTPHPTHRKPNRVSWQPSMIEREEENSMMKTLVSEIMNESVHQQKTIVDSLQLLRREHQTFDGNTLKYWTFMQSFRTNVGNKEVDDASKLSCLLQYCTGQARKILEWPEMMPPETGYKRALEILELLKNGSQKSLTEKMLKAPLTSETSLMNSNAVKKC